MVHTPKGNCREVLIISHLSQLLGFRSPFLVGFSAPGDLLSLSKKAGTGKGGEVCRLGYLWVLLGVRVTGFLVLLLTSCVTRDKLPNLSGELEFSHM